MAGLSLSYESDRTILPSAAPGNSSVSDRSLERRCGVGSPYLPKCALDKGGHFGQSARVLLAVRRFAGVSLTFALIGVAACSTDTSAPVSRVAPASVPVDLDSQVSKFVYGNKAAAGSLTIIGLPGGSPFGRKDAVIEIDDQSTISITAGDTIRGGVPAEVAVTSIPGGTSRSMTWNEDGTTLVTARSLTLGMSELKALVEDLTISDDHRVSLGTSEAGLRVLGVVPLPIYTSGYRITYGSGERYLSIDVHPTSGDEMLLYEWGPTESDSVAGRSVLRFRADRGAVPGYVFEFRPGLIVKVEGSVSDDELRAAVTSLHSINDDEYANIPDGS